MVTTQRASLSRLTAHSRLFVHLLRQLSLLLLVFSLAACATNSPAPVSDHGRSSLNVDQNGCIRVKNGDTLYAISRRSGKSVKNLARWNYLHYPYTIYPGKKLRVTGYAWKPKKKKTSRSSKKSRSKSSGSAKKTASSKSHARARSKKSSSGTRSRGGISWKWPTRGTVSGPYSASNPERKGILIKGRAGQPVYAAAAGKIVYSGSGLRGYGRLIIIKHDKNYLSAYGHNRKLLVKEGQKVARGQKIAEMGSNAQGATVLHFEIRRRGKPVNPVSLLP
ncbi:MAG: peptidoglycan DD-metalloendopeptidase family protein [gamma proteobacterium symbiont of Bathyaustriella thionipta]|nr:peptidoglycan DD-metalloendopeptidase family protein [gamma proteobacterium symbiont of Bathyaustriella thionipta]